MFRYAADNGVQIPVEVVIGQIQQVFALSPYYPCVLLVHTDIRRLQQMAAVLVQRCGWMQLEVGQIVTDAIARVPQARRSAVASASLDGALARGRPGPVICLDLAVLFEPLLALDPLVLLRQWSRRIPVVACWPGVYTREGLAYAVPEHAHYRLWTEPSLCPECIVTL